jgi:hypothetical protein
MAHTLPELPFVVEAVCVVEGAVAVAEVVPFLALVTHLKLFGSD